MSLPSRPRVVITGAGSGFGRGLARVLARRGARLVLSDIDEVSLAETQTLVDTDGVSEIRTMRCDVRDAEQVEAQAALADEAFGGADLVVNNAGVAVSGPIGDVPLEDWRWQIDINLYGVIHGCHSHVPRLKKQGSGHILNVASAAGLLAAPEMGPYNVTKAGVVALTETLAGELVGTGVGASALCPTFFRTNIHVSARSTDPSQQQQAERLVTRSKWSAEQIAKIALKGIDRGELYIIPQGDGRAFWRAKRLLGSRFYSAIGAALKSPRLRRFVGND